MRSSIVALVVCLFAGTALTALSQQPAATQWTGVWQGKLDGLPSVTLTLADDTGRLDGTLVLNLIEKPHGGEAHVFAIDPHTLVNPHIANGTLEFRVVKKGNSGGLMGFTVAPLPDGNLQIHCVDCGSDAPTVEMARMM